MTTIGTAVLQIIPSLKGVSEAIEKQIDGKVVEVKVAPKVDQTAAKKAGQEAGATVAKEANAAADKTPIQPKVDQAAAKKAGQEAGDAVVKGTKETVQKSGPGKDIAKVIVDGLADGVKQGLPRGGVAETIVDGLTDGVKQGIDRSNIGPELVGSIGDVFKRGNLSGTIKDAVLPGIKQIGTDLRSGSAEWVGGIANALRSGDIQSASDEIGKTVRTTTDIIATIGSTFGLQVDGVRDFGADSATTLDTVVGHVQDVLGRADEVKRSFTDTGELLGNVLPGRAGSGAKSIIGSLGTIIPVATGVFEALDRITQSWHADQQERFWERQQAESHAREVGAKPPQPGIGEVGGPPAPGQGNAPFLPPKPSVGGELRAKVAAGQLPGYSIAPNGAIIGPDGKPLPGFGYGGTISGLGTGISDSILAMVSNGEYIVNADATRKNLPLLEIINSGKLPGFSGGGQVGPDVSAAQRFVGTAYSQGNRTDCSGMVARVINAALGRDGGGLMSTKNAEEWLTARGFVKGTGGPGQISVGWYDHGPNPNDGHMAMTLSDGENAESGGKNSVFTLGPSASGASSPQFDQHMYLPNVYGEGPAGSSSAAPLAVGSAASSSGGGGAVSSSSSGGGGGISLPSTFSGLAGFGLGGLGKGVGQTPLGTNDLSGFGKAAESAVSGQVSSALGVLGISDAPPFLKAASMLLGGISVGGDSSANPLSASPSATGTTPPDDAGNMHGTRAGQQAGPVNIYARDTEAAFDEWQRRKNLDTAAKFSAQS